MPKKRSTQFLGQNIQTSDLRAISLDSFKDTKHPVLTFPFFVANDWAFRGVQKKMPATRSLLMKIC